MKTFKEFLNEKVHDQYLYHNTDHISLNSILKHGAIGVAKDWSSNEGVKSLKKGGYVSFSRSKHYQSAPGTGHKPTVRLVFNRDRLKQRYKIRPHADLNVTKSNKFDDTVKGAESRWESEEKVKGPVYLKHGLERIELHPNTKKDIEKTIINHKNQINTMYDRIKMHDKGYFWHKQNNKYQKFETDRQRRVHKKENMILSIQTTKKRIKELSDILNHPKLVVSKGSLKEEKSKEEKNKSFNNFLYRNKKYVYNGDEKMHGSSGAGKWGTKKLLDKYKKETPGQ